MYFSDSLNITFFWKSLQSQFNIYDFPFSFQPHDSGYVLLGDLTLDSSTDPEDVYHMVRWTISEGSFSSKKKAISANWNLISTSCVAGSTVAVRCRVHQRQYCARGKVKHSIAAERSEGKESCRLSTRYSIISVKFEGKIDYRFSVVASMNYRILFNSLASATLLYFSSPQRL